MSNLCTFLQIVNSERIAVLFVFYLQIPDDYKGYSLEMFCLPKHYENDVESILIPKGLICDR